MSAKVESHKEEVLDAMKEARLTALEAIGSKAAGYALMLSPVDTGRLKNSITWATQKSEGRSYSYSDEVGNTFSDSVGTGVPDDAVAIGTNVEYAVYQELGTSKIDAHPFLRPAIENHLEEYKKIMISALKDA